MIDGIINLKNKRTMTSLEISEITGKEHKNVIRDIRDEIGKLGIEKGQLIFEPSSYINSQNKEQPMYLLTLDGVLQLGARYSADVRYKLIQIARSKLQPKEYSVKDLLIMQLESIERIEKLEIENKKQKEEIKEQSKVIEHKKEVIKGITGDITLLEKRQILNRIVRYKGSNYKERWNELYRIFKETYHIDIKARFEGYKLKYTKGMVRVTSKLDYAEKFGYLDKLFKIATKLYEDDMKEILENFREVITV